MEDETGRRAHGHGAGQCAPAADPHQAGQPHGGVGQGVVESRLHGVVDERPRQDELQQPEHDPGDHAGRYAAAHGQEDDGQHLEAHRAALRHGEEAHVAQHHREGDGDAHLGHDGHRPACRVRRCRRRRSRRPAGAPACRDEERVMSGSLSLRWHYPAAPLDAATPEGGQVRRVGARKRLLSSSARSSAGPLHCSAPPAAAQPPPRPPRALSAPGAAIHIVSQAPVPVRARVWKLWITSFSHAVRLTTAVDKAVHEIRLP